MDVVSWDVGDLRGHLGRHRTRHIAEALEAEYVFGNELHIDPAVVDEKPGDCQCQGAIGTRTRLDEQLGTLARLRPARVDHDQLGAAVERLFDERHLMDVRFGGVLPPHHDQAGVGDIPGRAVLVVAQRQASGLEPSRPAQISVGGGTPTVEAPEVQSDTVQKPLGAAAGVVENALGAGLGAELLKLLGDEV